MTTPLSGTAGIEQLTAFSRGRQSLKEAVWYSGDLLTFLATGKDTQGRFALLEVVARKGNVPPPHIHRREDETFYILAGEITASVGGQTIKGTPGTMIFLPRNVTYSFETNPSRCGCSCC
jgi:quercetin dioxygenase-like cupin family protein